jgi:hypothetical protein
VPRCTLVSITSKFSISDVNESEATAETSPGVTDDIVLTLYIL